MHKILIQLAVMIFKILEFSSILSLGNWYIPFIMFSVQYWSPRMCICNLMAQNICADFSSRGIIPKDEQNFIKQLWHRIPLPKFQMNYISTQYVDFSHCLIWVENRHLLTHNIKRFISSSNGSTHTHPKLKPK